MADHVSNAPEPTHDPNKKSFLPCLKVSIYFKKIDSISHDQFYEHWSTNHAPLAMSIPAFRKHVVKYVQYHHTPEMKKTVQSLGETVLDYDGCAEIYVRTWDDWMTVVSSEEFTSILVPDCRLFAALPFHYMVGYENLVVGDTTSDLGGKNGAGKILDP